MQAKSDPRPIQVSEADAAKITGVCGKTLYNERRAGRLQFGRVGKKIVYRLEELDRWSKSNTVDASALAAS